MLSRRALLVGLAVGSTAVVTGCTTNDDSVPVDPTSSAAEPDNDLAVAESVVVNEIALVAMYEQVIASTDNNASTLALLSEIANQHRLHAQAMPTTYAPPAPSPPMNRPTIDDLIAAERNAADQRTSSCMEATAENLTRSLALIAASEASHVQALSQVIPT